MSDFVSGQVGGSSVEAVPGAGGGGQDGGGDERVDGVQSLVLGPGGDNGGDIESEHVEDKGVVEVLNLDSSSASFGDCQGA